MGANRIGMVRWADLGARLRRRREWPKGQHWAVISAAERHGLVEHVDDRHEDEIVMLTQKGADELEEAEGMLPECPLCGRTNSHSHDL